MTYQCKECGETHLGLPDIGFQRPDPYFGVPEHERESRVFWNSDTCVIDDEDFFIRGVLLIPVHNQMEQFGLGVWISQSQESFETYREKSDTDEIGPFFGWLSNELPYYEQSTLAMKTRAHFQKEGNRPLIELEECGHPLSHDIQNGISLDTAWQYVHWKNRKSEA